MYTRIWFGTDQQLYAVRLDDRAFLVEAAGPFPGNTNMVDILLGNWAAQEGVAEEMKRRGPMHYNDVTSVLMEAIKQQAQRKAGIHADDCLSQYPLPTGMGNWHCTCGAAIDPD